MRVNGLTNQVLQILWILCKINLLLENLWRMQEILFLGNLGLKFLFLNITSSHTHAFCSKFQYFELILDFFQKAVFFLKFSEPLLFSIDPFYFLINRKFLNMFERASDCFDQSKLIFDRSNFFQIVLLKSLSVSIDQGWFSIDWNSWIMFFKKSDWT